MHRAFDGVPHGAIGAARFGTMGKHLFIAALLAFGGCKSKSSDVAADNTQKNERDHATAPTADNSGKSGTDEDITQKVRKGVMDDSSLSTTAHNCKIVVEKGTVTLVGPVKSLDESTRVASIAANVVGAANVVNKLEVSN